MSRLPAHTQSNQSDQVQSTNDLLLQGQKKLLQFSTAALRISQTADLPAVFQSDLYDISRALIKLSYKLSDTPDADKNQKTNLSDTSAVFHTNPCAVVDQLVATCIVLQQSGYVSVGAVDVLQVEAGALAQVVADKRKQSLDTFKNAFDTENMTLPNLIAGQETARRQHTDYQSRSSVASTSATTAHKARENSGAQTFNTTDSKDASRSRQGSPSPSSSQHSSVSNDGHNNGNNSKGHQTAKTPNPREETIKNFLKNNGFSSISEIAAALPSVSNKTVQRDLQNLIDTGFIVKEGERRWSRYKLVR